MAIYFLFPSHSSKRTRNSYIGLLYSKKDALITLKSLYCTMAVVSVIATTKMITMFGLYVPGGVIVYATSFLVTDLISEIYEKKLPLKQCIAVLEQCCFLQDILC